MSTSARVKEGGEARGRKLREGWVWDVQTVSSLDTRHRASLSEMLKALWVLEQASWEKVI